jgi:predicted nucleic acid-binding protein
MMLVDTNVVSETMRLAPNEDVIAWLDAQLAETLRVSAVSLAELLLGVALLPEGRRKRDLDRAFRAQEEALFGSRIVPFGELEAKAYPVVVRRARAHGHAISVADGQIAATAAARGFTVVTRDLRPFEAAGLAVVDPWRALPRER